MDITQNISILAKRKGITLTQVERSCGFSKSSIRKWSENIPSIEKILKVADYFDCSVDYLLTGNGVLVEWFDFTPRDKQRGTLLVYNLKNIKADG